MLALTCDMTFTCFRKIPSTSQPSFFYQEELDLGLDRILSMDVQREGRRRVQDTDVSPSFLSLISLWQTWACLLVFPGTLWTLPRHPLKAREFQVPALLSRHLIHFSLDPSTTNKTGNSMSSHFIPFLAFFSFSCALWSICLRRKFLGLEPWHNK